MKKPLSKKYSAHHTIPARHQYTIAKYLLNKYTINISYPTTKRDGMQRRKFLAIVANLAVWPAVVACSAPTSSGLNLTVASSLGSVMQALLMVRQGQG
jgi:hypothetical protein